MVKGHSPVFADRGDGKRTMDFYSALRRVMLGDAITKLEWGNNDYYGLVRNGRLMIHKPDGKYYDWLLSDGDMSGMDWVVLKAKLPN